MKDTIRTRIRAAGCCAVFCLAMLLAGCTAAASSSPAPSSQALSEIPASEALPNGDNATTSAPTVDEEENGFNGLTDPAAAFARGLGWGPGTAGTSLKSVAAAAAMMDWAEQNRAGSRSAASLNDCLTEWYTGLESFDQENFAEAWPLIEDAAQRILDDPAGEAPFLEDAGVEETPTCSAEDWKALAGAMNVVVPAPMQ